MRASASPHGFSVVRRGYRAEQVDRLFSRLSAGRDEAWERVARLTVLAKEMEEQAAALQEQAAQVPPPTYEELGPRAQEILALAEAEAADLRDRAEAAAHEVRQECEEAARALREAARADATAVRAAADEEAREHEAAARAAAGELLTLARQETKAQRQEAAAALKEARKQTAAALAASEKEQAERAEAAERDSAAQELALDADLARREEAAERRLAEAQALFTEVREAVDAQQKAAEARGAELIAQAGTQVERIERATRRWLREHGQRQEEVRTQLEQVRSVLGALAGRDPGAVPSPAPAPGAEG